MQWQFHQQSLVYQFSVIALLVNGGNIVNIRRPSYWPMKGLFMMKIKEINSMKYKN